MKNKLFVSYFVHHVYFHNIQKRLIQIDQVLHGAFSVGRDVLQFEVGLKLS